MLHTIDWKKPATWFIVVLATLSLYLIYRGMTWLALGLLALAATGLIQGLIKSTWVNTALLTLSLPLAAIVLRVFVFEVVSIQSSSMKASILPGDIIIATKLPYGPLIPHDVQDIPWLNLLVTPAENNVTHQRLPGFSGIERNDIVLFRKPGAHEVFIKRCIGLPGDTLQIRNAIASIDGIPHAEGPHITKRYRVWSQNRRRLNRIADSLDVDEEIIEINQRHAKYRDVTLVTAQKHALTEARDIDSIRNVSHFPKRWNAYPHHDSTWTFDNLGPIVVPAKGLTMVLNAPTLKLYERVLRDYEGIIVIEKDGLYYINGTQVAEYAFQRNYYYVMGDNRVDSEDSRYFGFIPEEEIIEKGSFAVRGWRILAL